MRTISQEVFKNKKVVIRLDLDVPIDNNTVKDTTRLNAIRPTLMQLKSASQIIILGHLGRPDGKIVSELSLKPVATALSELINENIELVENISDIPNNTSKFLMLENLRFNPGEEANDKEFSKLLGSLGDLFVFEAFAVSHRAAASTVGITEFLPSYAGLRVTKEVEELSKILTTPEHPLLVIIGGAKIETKLPVINNMLNIADNIFVGGRLPKEIQEKNLTFPDKVVVAQMNESGLDISQQSQQSILALIQQAQMIVWNGPVGKFEDDSAKQGTQIIAEAIANSQAKTIIGGGETNQAASLFGIQDNIYFISVGGGAMLEFLSGKDLPAISLLK